MHVYLTLTSWRWWTVETIYISFQKTIDLATQVDIFEGSSKLLFLCSELSDEQKQNYDSRGT